ncbi:MAG: acetyl-CoA carboxylase biotin carboxyl carrier protein [Gammaproteobacteria bacterium]|nr:acetyl-CoA carboxylase biotin carboxyl carrier protein [Gammaproteobacteria bacterium]
MDVRKIKKLMDMLEQSGLVEMEIREGEDSIRLSRAAPAAVTAAPVAAPAPAEPRPAGEQKPETEVSGFAVKAPMVGTFYAAPNADAAPFVQVGGKVKAGDTLCIIEAMKIFNQIEAEKAGTVTAVLKESGDPVEYGELLFVID